MANTSTHFLKSLNTNMKILTKFTELQTFLSKSNFQYKTCPHVFKTKHCVQLLQQVKYCIFTTEHLLDTASNN